ncbi:MAG: lysine--tRNA ligase [Patescibacteria group bacterium]
MSSREEQELKSRLDKLKQWSKLGTELYPSICRRQHTSIDIIKLAQGQNLTLLGEDLSPTASMMVYTAGRLMTLRPHGSLVFATLQDQAGLIQLAWLKNKTKPKEWELVQALDRGDIIAAAGPIVKTKSGEVTVLVKEFTPLAKALRPLPEKWHGLKDVEARLRQRYVDLMMSAESRELFIKKSRFWQTVRSYLMTAGFMEVDTSALEVIAGGADATPFVTHHQALDKDFYLRISLELPLKRLLVGGYEKVFEIGKVFRNEGIDTEHLQDYTMCEFYWAYANYEDLMSFTQKMYQEIVQAVTHAPESLRGTVPGAAGGLTTTYQGTMINWAGEWPRRDYFALIKEISGEDLAGVTEVTALRKLLDKHHLKYEASMGVGRLIDLWFKKKVRPQVTGPIFLINHPVEVSPLAKRDPKNPARVQRLQIIAGGSELGNGFSELNDPFDQRSRFAEQAKLRAAGDSEAMMLDEDFITALEYGMPPAAGFGLSERLFSFIVDKSIRETTLFPPMRDN